MILEILLVVQFFELRDWNARFRVDERCYASVAEQDVEDLRCEFVVGGHRELSEVDGDSIDVRCGVSGEIQDRSRAASDEWLVVVASGRQ